MSLADIIAAKKTGCGEATNRPIASLSAPPSPAIVDDSDCFTLVKIEQPDIPEIKIYEAKNYIEPNEELFVAAWTPFLLHPYTFEHYDLPLLHQVASLPFYLRSWSLSSH
jgi:hypothetical protein